MFETPNLDCMDPSDLLELSELFSKLSQYARSKADAMRVRAAGHIKLAEIHEKLCESIYRQIDKKYRW